MLPYFGWAYFCGRGIRIRGKLFVWSGGEGLRERGRRTHETHQTAPSCLEGVMSDLWYIQSLGEPWLFYPRNVSVSLWVSPSISKILMVLSEEHVANRRP